MCPLLFGLFLAWFKHSRVRLEVEGKLGVALSLLLCHLHIHFMFIGLTHIFLHYITYSKTQEWNISHSCVLLLKRIQSTNPLSALLNMWMDFFFQKDFFFLNFNEKAQTTLLKSDQKKSGYPDHVQLLYIKILYIKTAEGTHELLKSLGRVNL